MYIGYFTDVSADFQSKMPVIGAVAHHDGCSYSLQIVVSNAECVETSRLLGVYSQLDPRVRPLVITFRYWAKVSAFLIVVPCCCIKVFVRGSIQSGIATCLKREVRCNY